MIRPISDFAEFQSEVPLAKELPYWDFMEDLVVLADGTLAMGFRLQGLSIETWDLDAVNTMVVGFRAMLNSLPDGLEISFMTESGSDLGGLVERHEAMKKCGAANVKADLDGKGALVDWVAQERVAQIRREVAEFRLFKTHLYAFIYRRFDSNEGSGVISLVKSFFSSPRMFQDVQRKEHEKSERDLRHAAAQVTEVLGGNGVKVHPLSGLEVWKMLYQFLNPTRSHGLEAPVQSGIHREQEFNPAEIARLPELAHSTPREQLCFSDLIQGYDGFFLDGYYHRVVSFKTLPEFTHSALMARLGRLPFPHLVHVHVQVPEQSKELAKLQAKRRIAHSMSMSQDGRASDLESEARLHSTEELLRELINTGQKIFYFQAAILIRTHSRDELELRTKAVLSAIRELNGAEGLAETVAGFKVWKTLLPLGLTQMVRPKRVKTDNLADFLPLYLPYCGSVEEQEKPVCLFRNRSAGLVAFDPFNSNLPNYNTLVTGSSGMGKSFLNNLVLLQYMTQKPQVYIIDIGGSYRKLCEFLGGQYVEITPPGQGENCQTINPFALPSGQSEPSPQKVKFLLVLLENILTDLEGDKLPKLDKSLLEEAVLSLYKTIAGGDPTFSDLSLVLKNSGDERLRQFARMMFPWTGDRPYGRLLDGEHGLNVESEFVVFDLKSLASYPDLQAVMILIITDFILGRLESKDPSGISRPKRILMDECWALLKSEASSLFMEYCVRTLRKTGAGITFITQGLDEIVASPIGGAILSNTATKFILRQMGDLDPVRKILKLNEQEMALIRSLRQVKGQYSEAFLMANEARSVIRVCPTPVEYWLATSDSVDNALLESVRVEFPEKSLPEVIHWLAERFPQGSQGVGQIPAEFFAKGVA